MVIRAFISVQECQWIGVVFSLNNMFYMDANINSFYQFQIDNSFSTKDDDTYWHVMQKIRPFFIFQCHLISRQNDSGICIGLLSVCDIVLCTW